VLQHKAQSWDANMTQTAEMDCQQEQYKQQHGMVGSKRSPQLKESDEWTLAEVGNVMTDVMSRLL